MIYVNTCIYVGKEYLRRIENSRLNERIVDFMKTLEEKFNEICKPIPTYALSDEMERKKYGLYKR